ncbi:hypothetical protein AQUCO_11300004v1 [Aquilegia coerulea]|uniref:Uncharacterized protein n=1 Tax=Aquilegia coerulea TaxID=218851 RepID=A0A2G5C2H8_AQUCA|nr:hypothetical protein AQUCO_11300004v1 [Aquilegia coerulea]
MSALQAYSTFGGHSHWNLLLLFVFSLLQTFFQGYGNKDTHSTLTKVQKREFVSSTLIKSVQCLTIFPLIQNKFSLQ